MEVRILPHGGKQEENMQDTKESLITNPFFAALPPDISERLCDSCQFRIYARNQSISVRYWQLLTAVLEEGAMIFGSYDAEGRFITSGLAGRGTLISPGTLIDVWHEAGSQRDILCLFDCKVAVFDTALVQTLFQDCIPFIHTVYGNIRQHYSVEKQQFLEAVGGRDSYAAVRYILQWCQAYRIPPLTHEQIALLCNRSRPTVTETLHRLLRQEPELFQTVSP